MLLGLSIDISFVKIDKSALKEVMIV